MKKNRVLSILLALTLLLGLLPAVTPPAQAADYVQPKFAAQPADVYMPEGGTGVLTWAFDVDPSECIEPELYLSATGYLANLLKGYYEAADHSRLKLQKEMSIRLNYTYAPLETSYAITNVYNLLLDLQIFVKFHLQN